MRINAYGKFGVYKPYESCDGEVGWTVQRFDPGDEVEDYGEIIGEFSEQHYAELFAEAAFEDEDALRLDKLRDYYDRGDG